MATQNKSRLREKAETKIEYLQHGQQEYFWEVKTRVGRKKLFSSPEVLWEEAMKYFKWCVDNPLYSIDYKGKDAEEVWIPKMRAFTWQGLHMFLGIETLRFYKKEPQYAAFLPIIKRIGDIMYRQKFEGAAAGFLNSSIIARDLKLVEHQVIKNKDPKRKEPDLSKFSKEELIDLIKKAKK